LFKLSIFSRILEEQAKLSLTSFHQDKRSTDFTHAQYAPIAEEGFQTEAVTSKMSTNPPLREQTEEIGLATSVSSMSLAKKS